METNGTSCFLAQCLALWGQNGDLNTTGNCDFLKLEKNDVCIYSFTVHNINREAYQIQCILKTEEAVRVDYYMSVTLLAIKDISDLLAVPRPYAP